MKYFYREFELEVPKSVYYPREDSELLANGIYEFFEKNPALLMKGKGLDIGTGSGLMAIVMADLGFDVTAVDLNEDAIATARKNASANGFSIDAIQSDLFSEIQGRFSMITFNPPYLEGEELLEEDDEKSKLTYDGGHKGQDVTLDFIEKVDKYLADQGHLFLILSSINDIEDIVLLLEKKFSKVEIIKKQHIFFEDLVVVCCRK